MRQKKRKRLNAMGTIEIILIIVVLVTIVIIFKDQITSLVSSLFSRITSSVNSF